MWLDFETRMRRVISDLVGPMLIRQQADSEVVVQITKDKVKIDERLNALELIVFKDESVATLIDDLRLRIEQGEAETRKQIAVVRDRADNKFDEINEKIFSTDARITANEILKKQYDVFVEKQEMLER